MKAACLLALALLTACDAHDDANAALERMTAQKRVNTWTDPRPLPEGTIPRESEPNPVRPDAPFPGPLTRAQLARGRDRYDIYCAPCHGLTGAGEGLVGSQLELVHPPPLVTDSLRTAPPGRIYRVISDGYGLMPRYAAQLSHTDRWAIVAYVRALQVASGVPILSLPTAVQAEARRELR